MKRIFITLVLIATAFSSIIAQKGLNVQKVFSDNYTKLPDAVATYITGDKLADYNLSIYRSLTLACDATTADIIEQLVLSDGAAATDKEVLFRNGHLKYGFYILRRRDGENRYLFYTSKPANGKNSRSRHRVTVVFMQGSASKREISNMIK